MFRPKKHIKLNPLTGIPNLDDLQRALNEAQKHRASTVELPWGLIDAKLFYSLAVRAEFGPSEPVWTLYEGEGSKSHVVWSAPFTDLELLKEVVFLTVAESTGMSFSNLPALDQALLTRGVQWQEAEHEVKEKKDNAESKQKNEMNETTIINQSPVPYGYFYPGYPYPIPYAYPPAVSAIPIAAETVSLQQHPELFNKQKTFLLGQFFIDTGLIAADTLNMILKLQEMITAGVINTEQAVEEIKKAHNQKDSANVARLIKKLSAAIGTGQGTHAKTAPLLGEILVKTEVINNSVLLAVLKLQEVVRSGAMTQAEACQALKRELASSKSKEQRSARTAEQEESAVELLVRAGLISKDDKETAYRVQNKHGGKIDNILAAAGKMSKKTFAAANECEYFLSEKKIKLEQAMIALHYCERSRVGLTEAIDDLGWRHDLDL